MDKLISWLGAGATVFSLLACGGKVVVDAGGDSGGAGGGGQGGNTTTGSSEPMCGDVVLPSPAVLTPCGDTSGSGGTMSCEQAVCDPDGNFFLATCSGTSCACSINGTTKCTCATVGNVDVCGAGAMPCCPWVPIPL